MATRLGWCIPVVGVLVVVLTAGAGASAEAQTQDAVPIKLSPALPAEGDAILASADVFAPPNTSAGPVNVEGGEVRLYVNAPVFSPRPPDAFQHLEWQLPALPAGSYQVSVDLPNVPNLGVAVRPRTAVLGLIGGRFQVSVAASQAGAIPAAVQLSDSGGYFTFFDPANVELTFKVVDGRAVNNHYWVFVASMTDTPLTITVTDTQGANCSGGGSPCPSRTYTSPPHTNQNFIDVVAF